MLVLHDHDGYRRHPAVHHLAVGGRGREAGGSQWARRNDDDDGHVSFRGAGRGDAFVQILKELVENAVDACCVASSAALAVAKGDDNNNDTDIKRVRVKITSEVVPVRIEDSTINFHNNAPPEEKGMTTKMMNCLRIEVIDTGCGMQDIDHCVSAFSSNKIDGIASSRRTNNSNNSHHLSQQGGKDEDCNNDQMHPHDNTNNNNKKKKGGSKSKKSHNNNSNKQKNDSNSNENYTSGRYGIGLTLCLLHAQRLVPGTGASITSATATSNEWTRAIYEPDTNADHIVCKRKEYFPKEDLGECGTTINLLVPVSNYYNIWLLCCCIGSYLVLSPWI